MSDDKNARIVELTAKLALARGMLYSAQGVIAKKLPEEDCTSEDIQKVLDETKDHAKEWAAADAPVCICDGTYKLPGCPVHQFTQRTSEAPLFAYCVVCGSPSIGIQPRCEGHWHGTPPRKCPHCETLGTNHHGYCFATLAMSPQRTSEARATGARFGCDECALGRDCEKHDPPPEQRTGQAVHPRYLDYCPFHAAAQHECCGCPPWPTELAKRLAERETRTDYPGIQVLEEYEAALRAYDSACETYARTDRPGQYLRVDEAAERRRKARAALVAVLQAHRSETASSPLPAEVRALLSAFRSRLLGERTIGGLPEPVPKMLDRASLVARIGKALGEVKP